MPSQLASALATLDVLGSAYRVGAHRPPGGGLDITLELDNLLDALDSGQYSAYEIHCRYERLHPFMDGNGRSGRALWAWQMQRAGLDPFGLGFLHRFYYQALDASRA